MPTRRNRWAVAAALVLAASPAGCGRELRQASRDADAPKPEVARDEGDLWGELRRRLPARPVASGPRGVLGSATPSLAGFGLVVADPDPASPARFVSRGHAGTLFFTPSGWTLVFAGPAGRWAVALRLLGAAPVEPLAGREARTRISSYGPAARDWLAGAPAYGSVVYREVWPGIDLICEPRADGFKYALIVRPGADPGAVRLAYEGASDVRLDASGDLVLETGAGTLRDLAPRFYQGEGGVHPVDGRFAQHADGSFGFAVGAYDRRAALLIDPQLIYATYLGETQDPGQLRERFQVAPRADGSAVVCGYTQAVTFPTTPGAYDTSYGGALDAFVAQVAPSGDRLDWATFLGGTGADACFGVAVTRDDRVVVIGETLSLGFPTTNGAWDTQINDGGVLDGDGDGMDDRDAFVAQLRGDGGALEWSTLIGGDDDEFATALATGTDGDVYLAGTSFSSDFPTTGGAFSRVYATRGDVFVARLAADGTALRWSTLLGGSNKEEAAAIKVDAAGRVALGGWTLSPDLPVTPGALDVTWNGNEDVFAAVFADGGALTWSTFLGGLSRDLTSGVLLASGGDLVVTGSTLSASFPTTAGALQTTPGGNFDTFVARLSADGATLRWATLLGGAGADICHDVATDLSGNIYLAGHTLSFNFPTTAGAHDRVRNGVSDGFVARLAPNGRTLTYATLLGGSDDDRAHGIAWRAGALLVAGRTSSIDFPVTAGAFDTTANGAIGVFVSQLRPPPEAPRLVAPFDNQEIAATTPALSSSTPADAARMHFEVQWDTLPSFDTSASRTRRSDLDAGFSNRTTPTDVTPFAAGEVIAFDVPSGEALTGGQTYWWRARLRDPVTGELGPYSAPHNFTVDTGASGERWVQTTEAQLAQGVLAGTRVTSTGEVELSGSAAGSVRGPEVVFDAFPGAHAAWDALAWSEDEAAGAVSLQVLYDDDALESTEPVLVPEWALPGNAAGFTTSPVALSRLGASLFQRIFPRALLTPQSGSPRLLDWSVSVLPAATVVVLTHEVQAQPSMLARGTTGAIVGAVRVATSSGAATITEVRVVEVGGYPADQHLSAVSVWRSLDAQWDAGDELLDASKGFSGSGASFVQSFAASTAPSFLFVRLDVAADAALSPPAVELQLDLSTTTVKSGAPHAFTGATAIAKALGASCGARGECASGHCVDGVCCNTPCSGGPCDACSLSSGAPSNGTCVYLGAGSPCADGDLCNGAEACNGAGQCLSGTPLVCSDGSICNGAELCDPSAGCRPGTPLAAGASCADTNLCNGNETCDGAGGCRAGTVPPEGSACSDGNVCNGAETCDGAGGCRPGTSVAPGTPCPDATLCNGNETCDGAGSCRAGTPPTCSDGNPCNGLEGCAATTGCVPGTPPAANTPCPDANVCNGVETCDGVATCRAGTPLSCDNLNVCDGVETCLPSSGCVAGTNLPLGASCADDDVCDGAETCSGAGVCRPGVGLSCDDGNPCNGVEGCDATSGCVPGTAAPAGTSCADANPCDGVEQCDAAGSCLDAPTPALAGTPCPDGSICNGEETCDGQGGCRAAATPAASTVRCADADVCNGEERCDGFGACLAAPAPAAFGTPCLDGDMCNGAESCDGAGQCRAGTPVFCADLLKLSGDQQARAAGSVLPEPFVVKVVDAQQVALPGVAVTWTVTPAGGLESFQSLTNSAGLASAVGRLGERVGVDVVTWSAQIEALGTNQQRFTATAFAAAPPGADAPLAVARVSPEGGPAPLLVTLDGADSLGSGGVPILLYRWRMGDTVLVTPEPIITHVIDEAGGYAVYLEVVDLYGLTDTDRSVVSVAAGAKQPPLTALGASPTPGDLRLVAFTSSSYDPDGQIAGYSWSFGDGASATVASPTHRYAQPGRYTARLTVRDNDGLSAYDLVELDLSPRPPAVTLIAEPPAGPPPLTVRLSASVDDPEGDPVSYRWRLPDGRVATTAAIELTLPLPGTYPFALEVEDAEGLSTRASTSVLVAGPPTIVSPPGTVAYVGAPYAYDADRRPTARGEGPLFWWLQTGPRGMAVDPSTGEVSWTPGEEQRGEHAVSLAVKNAAASATQSYRVEVHASPLAEVRQPPSGGCGAAPSGALGAALALLSAHLRRRRRSDTASTPPASPPEQGAE